MNGFILGCRKMLFVDASHLSGPYEGTLLGVVALDADNHFFDVAYAIVASENNDDWLWFLSVLRECLGGMKPVIMTDRHGALLHLVPRVFGVENHCYCLVHMRENFVAYAGKKGVGRKATKELVKEMFNPVAYAAIGAEYWEAFKELRQYKQELARWVEDNEPERWVMSVIFA